MRLQSPRNFWIIGSENETHYNPHMLKELLDFLPFSGAARWLPKRPSVYLEEAVAEKLVETRKKVDELKAEHSKNDVLEIINSYEEVIKEFEGYAIRDGLTGLLDYKRKKTREIMQKEVDERLEKGDRVWALFIDIDDFKRFNTDYGHVGGDLLLRVVARALGRTKLGDDLARNGGDEFVLIAKGKNLSQENIRKIFERIQDYITNSASRDGLEGVSLSVGGVELSKGDDLEEMVSEKANLLMLKAKETAGGGIVLISSDDR